MINENDTTLHRGILESLNFVCIVLKTFLVDSKPETRSEEKDLLNWRLYCFQNFGFSAAHASAAVNIKRKSLEHDHQIFFQPTRSGQTDCKRIPEVHSSYFQNQPSSAD